MIEDPKDVEMKDVPANKEENKNVQVANLIYAEYRKCLMNLEKAISIKDTKSLLLSYRQINKFRKHLNDEDISYLYDTLIRNTYNCPAISVSDPNTKETVLSKFNFSAKTIIRVRDTPEFIVFNLLIVITRLIDQKKFNEVSQALSFLVSYLNKNESHTLHYLRARTYHYYTFINEKLGTYSSILAELHSAYRKACLDLDEITQVTIINCIIRYYLLNDAYDQARNFISKTKYYENVSTNEDARYFFYLGTINSVQMNYTEAFINLTNSMRKAPEKCASDFKSNVQKLLIIVELLMGEVPDISKIITTAQNLKSLKPYFDLIKSVKQGNLNEFKTTLQKYEASFIKDKFYNLIQRLRHVVIKIGLRRINISYSRISLKDITEKLNLESEKDCEYIVAKAIRDGVFLAKINHEEGYVQSEEIKDIYSTFEPQKSFQRRILFLNNIYNDAMKAMKYSEKKDDKKKADKDLDSEDMFTEADGYLDF